MAQHKFKTEWTHVEREMPSLHGTIAVPSPARMLQQLIEQRGHEFAEPDIARWSQRKAVAFIVTSSAALWMAILVAGAQAAHAIA